MTTAHLTNGLDHDAAAAFLERIERLNADLVNEKSAYMLRCKPIHEAVRQMLDDAKEAGIRKKAMKVEIKKREHLRKIVKLENELEDDDRANYELLDDAIPGLDDLPLGIAALDRDRQAGRTTRGGPPRKGKPAKGSLESLDDGEGEPRPAA
jgi:hypothetical protein